MKQSLLSRRAFTTALVASPALLKGRLVASDAARIRLDASRTIAPIDPKLYGNFTEHLGRCIEGGIFEEGSPLADAKGFRRDVMKAVEDLHVSILRWPGGNFSSNYHWQDGIGPREARPRRLEMAWGTIEDNRFGTHEFLDYVAQIGAEPYICANLGTGSWDEAQQWVEYVNFDGDTATTRLRRKNGRDRPWNVKYWSLGNEMDGPWQMGHRTAEDYGKFALEAAKLMHWTDPQIRLVAAGSSNYGAGVDWIGWNRTVLEYLKDHIDYLSLHLYVGNPENDYYKFQASTVELGHRIDATAAVIRDALWGAPPEKKIYIAWDEWNVWYRARGNEHGRNILEEHYNLEDALVVSSFLNTFVNHADVVKIANMAQLVNVIAPIFTNQKGLFLQTIYYPLQLFATYCHGNALDLLVESPTYGSDQREVSYLDVSAAHQSDGTLVLNVTNRHRERALDAVFEAGNGQFVGEFQAFEVNGPDIKSENNFDKSEVKTTEKPSIGASGRSLKYRFPAHSFTMLKGRLA